jgi:hypothetical protein
MLITKNVLLKTAFQKQVTVLSISLFIVHDSAPRVAAGLINVLDIFIFLFWLLIYYLEVEEPYNMVHLDS